MQYTYNTLLASCQNYCIDNSIVTDTQSYAAEFPNLVKLSEMRMIKDLNLSVFDTVATGVMTSNSQDLVKPADMIALQDLFVIVNSKRVYLQLRSKSWLDSYWPDYTVTDVPVYYADNTTDLWQITPTPDFAYSYQANYIARPLSMSATNQNTWLGDKLGEVLLYATLVESALYFREDPTIQTGVTQLWEKAYETLMTQAQTELAPFVSAKDNTLLTITKTVQG